MNSNELKGYLIDYFRQAEKPKDQWKIGIEQEVMGFDPTTRKRVTYESHLRLLLEKFVHAGWQPYYEGGNLIAAKKEGANLTLEPGAQLENSLPPLATLAEAEARLTAYQLELHELSQGMKVQWYSLGYDPVSNPTEIPLVPKKRYQIMSDYLPKFGSGAHHMMRATCTAQTNLDFSSEQDMARKMLVTVALSPLVSILFASSPFRLGGLSGYKNTRNWSWRAMDPARSGFLDCVFEPDFGYERYARYVQQIPMMVLEREGDVLDFHGENFMEFWEKRLKGVAPEPKDWSTQLGCTFPVARLRNAIETRTADAGSLEMILAQAAFWKGLLYDERSLEASVRLAREVGKEQFLNLHQKAFWEGFDCLERSPALIAALEKTVQFAAEGLTRMDQNQGTQELRFLKPVQRILKQRQSLSDEMIQAFLEQEDKDVFEVLQTKGLIFA